MSIKQHFEIPARTKMWSISLMAVGVLSLIIGFITKGMSHDEHAQAIFWGTVLYNSLFFLMICNASMFFICATTLAMGSWITVFRRVPEAISSMVPIIGTIAAFLMIFLVLGNKHIYHWADSAAVAHDELLQHKSGFLNPTFFITWTVLTIGLWSLLGYKMRQLSRRGDEEAMQFENAQQFLKKNMAIAALFLVWFALTVGSVTPWFWMMSIDAHWYSTLYSWYTFASTFVPGMALVALWVIYLKNKGYLEMTNREHLHDLGKFMFAFSIFWTYLWFSQYMLIWYANLSEETVYFKQRAQGPYQVIFILNLIINFVCPILLLMTSTAKRNYTLMVFMAVLIIFGHWIDFYQMVMASISKDHVTLGWLDFGVAAFYIGLIIFFVTRSLASKPLVPKYNPFLKESIVHHV